MNNLAQLAVGQTVRFVSDTRHASPLRHITKGTVGHVVATDPDGWTFVNFDGRNCWTLRSELETIAR